MPDDCVLTFEPFVATSPFAKRFGMRQGNIYGQTDAKVELRDGSCRRLLAMPTPNAAGDIDTMTCHCPDGQVLTAPPIPNDAGDFVWQTRLRKEVCCKCQVSFQMLNLPWQCYSDTVILNVPEDCEGRTSWPMNQFTPLCYPRNTRVHTAFPRTIECAHNGHTYDLRDIRYRLCGGTPLITVDGPSVVFRTPAEDDCAACPHIHVNAYYLRRTPDPCFPKQCDQCTDLNASVEFASMAELTNCRELCPSGGGDTAERLRECYDRYCPQWQSTIQDAFPIPLEPMRMGNFPPPLSCGAQAELDLEMNPAACGTYPHPDPEPYFVGWSSFISLSFEHHIEFHALGECGRTRARIAMSARVIGDPFSQWDRTVNYGIACRSLYFGGAPIDLPNDWIDFGILPSIATACRVVREWVEQRNPWTFVDLNNRDSRFIKLNFFLR